MAEGGTLGLTRPYGVVPVLAAAAIGAIVGFLGAGPIRGFADVRDVSRAVWANSIAVIPRPEGLTAVGT